MDTETGQTPIQGHKSCSDRLMMPHKAEIQIMNGVLTRRHILTIISHFHENHQ